ncbi:MAG: helix-turn-helix domain-containing protein [Desulfobacterales bacterium]|nr:helix-turn-helix domain-containing protein [Desulfobacterales bacterium]
MKKVLKSTNWNRKKAAEILNISSEITVRKISS